MTGRPDGFAMAIALAAVVLALPLWYASAPAMPDYPAHLASYHLIATGAASPGVSNFYLIQWAFLPNLAGEIIIPLLSRLIGLDAAAKLFITASVMMWVIGPALIHRTLFGSAGVASLFAAFFAYNANFTWGFLNYYFSHLFAAATLLLMIGCFEFGGFIEKPTTAEALRRSVAVAVAFLPSALAFAVLKPAGGETGATFNLFARLLDRLEAAVQLGFDNPSFVLLGLVLVLLATGLLQGWIVPHRRMIVSLAVLALAALFAPEWAAGGWGVDLRLPAVLGALVFASADFRLERKAALVLAVACGAVITSSAVILAQDWRTTGTQFDEFRRAARRLPPGERLLTVLDGDAIGYRSDQPYWHMAEFAVIDPGAFTPLLFTTKDQHVVRLKPEVQSVAAASAQQGSPPDIDELNDLAAGQIDEDEDIANVFPYLMHFQCHYDVAVVIHLGGPRAAIPAMLKLRHAGSFFSLYDILPDASCGKQ